MTGTARQGTTWTTLAAAALLAACGGTDNGETARNDRATGDTLAWRTDSAAGRTGAAVAPPVRDTAELRVEIDVGRRMLHVIGEAGDTVAHHAVAVGSEEWPTRTGTWTIDQVVLNPAWTPPDESWAEEREPREPGDPKNPLGRAQLVYDLPRTIHGTNDPASIGKAVSHGSIRVTNAVALSLAELMLTATQVPGTADSLAAARRDSTRKVVVDLPRSVPIRVF